MPDKVAVIIGAGPAGLTAAFELLERTDIQPRVIEKTKAIGGIAQTVNYRGNRIDIGGHRFFSKSDRVTQWWLRMLPLQNVNGADLTLQFQGAVRTMDLAGDGARPDPEATDEVMLVRPRKSRIFFLRKLFDYPLKLGLGTFAKLGLVRSLRIVLSYLRSMMRPIRPEKNLEDFFINRFGRELYQTFFKSYTEKVWGVPCTQISAAWGAQRIKGVSLKRVVTHALGRLPLVRGRHRQVETSLIEQFMYPKFGPGQMWTQTAARVQAMGGEIRMQHEVARLEVEGSRIAAVHVLDVATGQEMRMPCDYVFSSMPVRELIERVDTTVPPTVREVSQGLLYRDFLTVGLLVDTMKLTDDETRRQLSDNWIYIQEGDVHVGRVQIFNNWSPYMVANPNQVWLGLEYFCNQGDPLWELPDDELKRLGAAELEKIGLIDAAKVRDATVIRMPKAYPAYFGSYDRFDVVREYLDTFENLYLIGRNGMHRYNNQDHSMLSAMTAVDLIIAGSKDKTPIWSVNAEQDYHESK